MNSRNYGNAPNGTHNKRKEYCVADEMFGDMKEHGFEFEAFMLHFYLRLSRLTLVVAFLYLRAITIGVRTNKKGFRHLVDRSDCRDLSIFQKGLRFINRRMTNHVSAHVHL